MSETKFLGDGRKVVVLGKLNNNEYIVQEIFIDQKGTEFPSGENFTTKNIHDTPLESYFEKEEKRKKQSVKECENEIERLKQEIRKHDALLKAKKDILANSPELKDLVGDKANILAMFMTGTVNYIVTEEYSLTKPQRMEDFIIKWDNYYGQNKYDGIKLVSVLGKTRGELNYKINRYNDGSGNYIKVYPFQTYEEAVEKIKGIAIKKITEGYLSKDDIKLCDEIGINFTQEIKNKIFEKMSENIQNEIDSINKRINSDTKQHNALLEDLSGLKQKFLDN